MAIVWLAMAFSKGLGSELWVILAVVGGGWFLGSFLCFCIRVVNSLMVCVGSGSGGFWCMAFGVVWAMVGVSSQFQQVGSGIGTCASQLGQIHSWWLNRVKGCGRGACLPQAQHGCACLFLAGGKCWRGVLVW